MDVELYALVATFLAVGLAVGFAAGYVAGLTDRWLWRHVIHPALVRLWPSVRAGLLFFGMTVVLLVGALVVLLALALDTLLGFDKP